MISFTFLPNSNFIKLNESFYKIWLKKVIILEGKKLGDVQYIFCSDDYLLEINTKFLNHDTLTDIITFSTTTNSNIISGEVFISTDRVTENSILHSTSFNNELSRVIVHGVLHLLGYDDHTPTEKKIMRSKEDYYLLLQAKLK